MTGRVAHGGQYVIVAAEGSIKVAFFVMTDQNEMDGYTGARDLTYKIPPTLLGVSTLERLQVTLTQFLSGPVLYDVLHRQSSQYTMGHYLYRIYRDCLWPSESAALRLLAPTRLATLALSLMAHLRITGSTG